MCKPTTPATSSTTTEIEKTLNSHPNPTHYFNHMVESMPIRLPQVVPLGSKFQHLLSDDPACFHHLERIR
jgi:hypothetical protein